MVTTEDQDWFWSRVDIRGEEECWEWTASRQSRSYGGVRVEGKQRRPNRVAYTLAHGPIPEGLIVRHSCDNPPCCNPGHLLLGTHADNARDYSIRKLGKEPAGVLEEKSGGRPRIYSTNAERQAAFRERRRQERLELLAQQRPARHARHEYDHYVSPTGAIRAALRLVENEPAVILDPCAGDDGRWALEAQRFFPQAKVMGIELRDVPPPQGLPSWYAPADFLAVAPHLTGCFDAVIGNPPYARAAEFVRAALGCLRDGGELVYLLRTNFREGQKRNGPGGLFTQFPLLEQAVCIERPVFYGCTGGQTSMSFFHWRKGWRGDSRLTSISIRDEAEKQAVIDNQ